MPLIGKTHRKSRSLRRAAARSLNRLGGGSILDAAEDPNVQRVLGADAGRRACTRCGQGLRPQISRCPLCGARVVTPTGP